MICQGRVVAPVELQDRLCTEALEAKQYRASACLEPAVHPTTFSSAREPFSACCALETLLKSVRYVDGALSATTTPPPHHSTTPSLPPQITSPFTTTAATTCSTQPSSVHTRPAPGFEPWEMSTDDRPLCRRSSRTAVEGGGHFAFGGAGCHKTSAAAAAAASAANRAAKPPICNGRASKGRRRHGSNGAQQCAQESSRGLAQTRSNRA